MLLALQLLNLLEEEAAEDTTPDAFSFVDQSGVALSTVATSDPITVSGIDTASDITVVDGEYSVNGGAFTADPGTVVNGDSVRARGTSSGSQATAVDVVVTIGGVSDTFTITTLTEIASGAGRKRDRRRRGIISTLWGRG